MGGQGGQAVQQADAVFRLFAEPDDATAADLHAGVAHMGQRIQSILVGTRGDDGAVMLGRGIEIVVVVVEARSEEHTSELQSLMRISYAVFCLKKKKNMHNDIMTVS